MKRCNLHFLKCKQTNHAYVCNNPPEVCSEAGKILRCPLLGLAFC